MNFFFYIYSSLFAWKIIRKNRLLDCHIIFLIIEVVIVIILIVNIYRVVENKSKNKNRSSLLAGLFKIKRKEEEEGKSWDTRKEIFQKETLASCDYYITRKWFHYRIFESLPHHFVYFHSFLHEWKRWNVDFARKEEDRKEALTFVSTTPMIY